MTFMELGHALFLPVFDYSLFLNAFYLNASEIFSWSHRDKGGGVKELRRNKEN
jgi:hypothetical protein